MVEEFASREIHIVAILDERPEFYNRSLNGYAIVGSPTQLSKIIEEYGTHGVEVHKVVIASRPEEMRPALWDDIQRACDAKKIPIEWLYDRFLISTSERIRSVHDVGLEANAVAPLV